MSRKALIVYATRTDQTRKIADLIAEGLRFSMVEVDTVNVGDFDRKGISLEEYGAVVLGAATYHGEMMQSMKTLLFALEKAPLEGKIGGSFGAYGWSGEAPGRIFDTMEHVFKMKMVSHGPLMLKDAALGGGMKMAQDYGRAIAGSMD